MEDKRKTRKVYKAFVKALRDERRKLPQIVSQLEDQKSFLEFCDSMYEHGEYLYLHDVVQNLTVWDPEMALESLAPQLLGILSEETSLGVELKETHERLRMLVSSLEQEVRVIHPMTELFDNIQLYYRNNGEVEKHLLSMVTALNEQFLASFKQRVKNYGTLTL